MEKEEVKKKFGFEKDAALLSRDAAEVKASSLTHALLHKGRAQGLQVYDHMEIVSIGPHRSNQRQGLRGVSHGTWLRIL